MKINFVISPHGNGWSIVAPTVHEAACWPNNKFDEGAFLDQIKNQPRVMVGSKEKRVVLAFASVLLSTINDWQDETAVKDEARVAKYRARCDKRIKDGRVSYCTLRLHAPRTLWKGRLIHGICADISVDDNGVACGVARYDREFAVLLLDFIEGFSRLYEERGDPPIYLGEGALSFFPELAVRREERRAEKCDRFKGGYCSPSNPACRFYSEGRCTYDRG